MAKFTHVEINIVDHQIQKRSFATKDDKGRRCGVKITMQRRTCTPNPASLARVETEFATITSFGYRLTHLRDGRKFAVSTPMSWYADEGVMKAKAAKALKALDARLARRYSRA